MDTKIRDTERKKLDALFIQRAEIDQKINAILDKHPHCFECGAFEGELHELGCDNERCPFCGGQLIACLCSDGDGNRIDRYPRTDEARAEIEPLRLPFVGDGRQLPTGYIPLNWRGEFDPMTGNGDFEGIEKDARAVYLSQCIGGSIYAEG